MISVLGRSIVPKENKDGRLSQVRAGSPQGVSTVCSLVSRQPWSITTVVSTRDPQAGQACSRSPCAAK